MRMNTQPYLPLIPRRAPKRAPRRDGINTRALILDAAGKIFAERGYADATSKEICELAGTNTAAVNYYFGGKDKLYEEVLVEAHQRFISVEDLTEIIAYDADPEKKLHAFVRRLIHTTESSPGSWEGKVLMREMAAPSPNMPEMLASAIQGKAALGLGLISEITGLHPRSAAAQRALAFVILPCISLIILPAELRTKVLPGTDTSAPDFIDDLMRYVLAGLRALAV